MAGTLKEQYEAKQVRRLQERLKPIDRRVLVELNTDPRDRLILEAFDKQQMAAAIDIVKKLKAMQFGKLASLASARDAAVADTTKALAGGKDQGLVRKIVNLFKSEKENPLVDTMAFASAMKNFFDQFTQYATALGGDESQTLGAAITGKSPDDQEASDFAAAVKGKNPKANELQKLIVQGMKPEGALANIGKNWIDKYLKGKKGLVQLANELFVMTLKELTAISGNIASSFKNADAVGQSVAGAAEQGAVASTGSTGSNASTASAPEQGSKGSKSGATAPGAQVAPGAAGAGDDVARKVYDDIKADFEGADEKTVMSILNTLAHNGKLKS